MRNILINLFYFIILSLISLLTHYCPPTPFGKFILKEPFSSVFLQFSIYHPSGNLKFNNLGIFQSLKFRILEEKILPISPNLNFTPYSLGCYGLIASDPGGREAMGSYSAPLLSREREETNKLLLYRENKKGKEAEKRKNGD